MSLSLVPATLKDLDSHNVLLQTGFWGAFKAEFGWDALPFMADTGNRTYPLLVLIKSLPAGRSLAYIGHGPQIDVAPDKRSELLAELAGALMRHIPSACMFLRFDLPWGTEGETSFPAPLGAPLVKAPMDIQPPDTVILDLTLDEDTILKSMKHKTRYNIGLAAKKGVIVTEESARALDLWYTMYEQTAARDRIALHPKRYYQRLFSLAEEYRGKAPVFKLLFARAYESILAGIIICLHGTRATYLYGASTDQHRNLMPAYALQMEAIRIAKAAGCTTYDLFGIPPNDDPSHPMHGLYRFKTGFGGTIVHRLGCYDVPYRKLEYIGYRGAEAVRKFYYKTLVKKFGGTRE